MSGRSPPWCLGPPPDRARRTDGHSQRIEAHAELILSAVAAKSDITLSELREQLKEGGVAVAIGTLWRFFKRRKITRKKRRRTPPNSAAAR